MANHANNDTKCTPGSRRGAFYFAWGAFSGGGVHVLFEGRLEEVLFCQEQSFVIFMSTRFSFSHTFPLFAHDILSFTRFTHLAHFFAEFELIFSG